MDLKTLTELRAPSGHEQPIRRALLAELKDMGLDPQLDRMGNVVVVQQGTKGADAPRVMVAAHMDEVGLLLSLIHIFPAGCGGEGSALPHCPLPGSLRSLNGRPSCFSSHSGHAAQGQLNQLVGFIALVADALDSVAGLAGGIAQGLSLIHISIPCPQ